ncbi:MAG: PDZ domain-containing protein [Deltaproteobacteria bacterium]|nr:PDZ domain-containing protein [Deltaproteobacteria bacterium]
MTKPYYTIFNILALSAIIYIGVDTFYRVVRAQLRQVNTEKVVMQNVPDIKRLTGTRLRDYKVITERNIFGSFEKPSGDASAAEIETLEPTSLKIALLGTVTGSQQNAVAVIEDTGKRKQGLYRVGDSIQSAVLKTILRGSVVLSVGDRDEVLTMEESSSSKTEKSAQVSRPVRNTGSERTITVRRSDVDKSLKDINNLLTQARIRPHFKDGQADGLMITGIKAGSIFRKMGMRNGDILHGINDIDIKDPDDIFAMYNDLKSGSSLSIQIIRRGRSRTLNYRFR